MYKSPLVHHAGQGGGGGAKYVLGCVSDAVNSIQPVLAAAVPRAMKEGKDGNKLMKCQVMAKCTCAATPETGTQESWFFIAVMESRNQENVRNYVGNDEGIGGRYLT